MSSSRPAGHMAAGRRAAVWFIVESGTDARLVEGLAERVDLRVIARTIPGGRAVSQPTPVTVDVAAAGRLRFALHVLWAILRADPCDGVLVQGYTAAALAANLAARVRRKRCWMLVCSPVAEYYETRRMAGEPFSRTALATINLLARLNGLVGQGYVVLSGHLADVVRRYGPAKPVQVVPVYGVDARRFRAQRSRAEARRQRGLPESGQIIFSSSRVAPEKDTATLLDAFARLVGEGRNVRLLHRSGGYQELLEQARRRGVADRVIASDAADPRGDLALDYAASDVCVQASRAEGLGFSVLEALACGTPVVASAVGGLVETVRNGVTGWSVRPGDAGAMAAALRAALDEPQEANRLAAAGAAMVRERYGSEAAFARLTAILTHE